MPTFAFLCTGIIENFFDFIDYEFLCLHFGLGPAPRIFTKLLKIPIAVLRLIQIRIIIYLDDMLLMSQTIETEIPKAYFKSQSNTMGSDQSFKFSLLSSTGSATSYATKQVFTTTANGSYKKQSLLPVYSVSERGFYSRTAMVVQQPRYLQRQTNCLQPPKQ